MRPRDSQRSAVYRWERAVASKFPECNPPLSQLQCRDLVVSVWKDRRPGEAPPRLRFAGHRTSAARRDCIRLANRSWAMRPIVVLHEVAHTLMPSDVEAHGQEFCELLLDLWTTFTDLPRRELRSMAVQQKPRAVKFVRHSLAADVAEPSAEWKEWDRMRRELARILSELRECEPNKYDS